VPASRSHELGSLSCARIPASADRLSTECQIAAALRFFPTTHATNRRLTPILIFHERTKRSQTVLDREARCIVKRLSTTDFAALDELLEQEVHADRGVDGLETVRRVFPKIQQLRDQGVPFRQILELLNRQGLGLSSSTLHRYLKRIDKEHRRGARARTPSVRAPTAIAPQLVQPPSPPAPLPRAPHALSLASKALPPADDGRKEAERTPVSTGHFMPPPDSERI
jgi:hypothetical protein